MKTNIKTYRYIANVFKSQLDWFLTSYSIDDKSLHRDFIIHSFKEKVMWCDNPHRNRAFSNEIKRLIGDELFYKLLTIMLNDVYNKSNKYIESQTKRGTIPFVSCLGRTMFDIIAIDAPIGEYKLNTFKAK